MDVDGFALDTRLEGGWFEFIWSCEGCGETVLVSRISLGAPLAALERLEACDRRQLRYHRCAPHD